MGEVLNVCIKVLRVLKPAKSASTFKAPLSHIRLKSRNSCHLRTNICLLLWNENPATLCHVNIKKNQCVQDLQFTYQ